MLAQVELKQNQNEGSEMNGIWQRITNSYGAYCKEQEGQKIYWYLKAIIVIPCVLMAPSIMAMAKVTDNYIPYIALTMVLFFANMVVHIGQFSGKLFVPIYHATIAIMVFAPIVAYYLSQYLA